MDSEWLAWIAVGLTVVLLVLVWVRTKPTSIAGAIGQIQQASETAKALVMAAEQLWLTGELQKDDRLYYVMERLQTAWPSLDEEQLRATAEAAVYWLKYVQPASKPPAAPKPAVKLYRDG